MEETPEYELAFSSLSQTWSYFLIATPDAYDDLKIEDPDSEDEISFDTIDPEDATETAQRVYTTLEEKYPDAEITLIQSETPVPRHQLGRTGMQLKAKKKLLIDDLANPSPGDAGIKVVNIMTVHA